MECKVKFLATMNNRKQNKVPKMKVYTGTMFFEAVRTDFIAYLEVQKDIQACDELSRRGDVGTCV